MNGKKVLLISALALVIAGCIFAAGCTSTTSSNVTDDMIVGTWNHTTEVGDTVVEKTDVFRPSGMGVEYQVYNNEYMLTKMFTWDRFDNSEGARFDVAFMDGTTDSFTYSTKTGKFTSSNGGACTRIGDASLDSIVGSWIESGYYEETYATVILIFKWDGTGLDVARLASGISVTYPFTWTKVGDEYKLSYSDDTEATVVLDTAANTLAYHDEEGEYDDLVYKDLEQAGLDPVVTTWTGSNTKDGETITVNTVFRSNGTGTKYVISPDDTTIKYTFIWQKTDSGYAITQINDLQDSCVYDSDKKTLTFRDGMVMRMA